MSFMDKLSAFASSVAETGREASHSMGFDKVGLGNDVYVEDDSANEVSYILDDNDTDTDDTPRFRHYERYLPRMRL